MDNQENKTTPQPNLPLQQPVAPQPIVGITPGLPTSPQQSSSPTASGSINSFSGGTSSRKVKLELISLILSVILMITYLVTVFFGDILETFARVNIYIGFFVVISLVGIVLGVLSIKNSDNSSTLGIVATIFASIIFINSAAIGAYTVKAQLLLNDFQKEFDSSSNEFNFDSSSDSGGADYNLDSDSSTDFNFDSSTFDSSNSE